ncbi:MAG: hypothetical protein QNJ90_00035 [Planctomycetota bacterium]|nr:hypothetical protein [Planctomycetota bacterium]
MDELWQRYRTFWTPVLIGLGVFLVGVIAVHVISDDPDKASSSMSRKESRLRKMKQPDSRKTSLLRTRGEALKANVMGAADSAALGWAQRVNQSGAEVDDIVAQAADQALRAAILRGAPEDVASNANSLGARFDGDAVAAGKAYRRFQQTLAGHQDTLRTGDPNVAWSRLLSDVWSDLRIRANRADVEISPIADQLGFSTIGSVSRATLPARVLNLALVARVIDVAIREGAESIESIQIPTNVDPGQPDDFLVLWPVDIVLVGDVTTVRYLLDVLTDPANPVPLEFARLTQPKASRTAGRSGLVQLSLKASSALVRPAADLKLDAEEE